LNAIFLKSMSRFLLFLVALVFLADHANASEDGGLSLLKKAEIMTFYSGSTLHSWYECNSALDSISKWEMQLTDADSQLIRRLDRIKEELLLGNANSGDNMNGIFPAYGAMTNKRPDYHFSDDPQEVLAEDLLGQFIEMPSKSRKGLYKDSGVFLLMSTTNADLGIVNVLIDFLNNATAAYVIRPHELRGLIPCDLEDGLCLQNLDASDWERLIAHFGADEILLLTLDSKAQFSSDVHYKGLRIQRFDKDSSALTFENYVEAFKTDKIPNKHDVIWLLIFGMFVSFVVLTAGGLFDYAEGSFIYVRDWQTVLHAKKNLFAIVFSIVVVNVVLLGSNSFAPDLNEYIWSSQAILWLLCIILLPPIAACVLTYFAMWRLMKDWSVNEMSNYSRLIQAAFLSAYVWFFSFDLLAGPTGDLKLYIIELSLASVFTLSPAWVMGKVITQVVQGGQDRRQLMVGVSVAILSWALLCIALYLSISNNLLLSNWLHLGGFVLAVIYLVILPKLKRKLNREGAEVLDGAAELGNPLENFTQGLNWNDAQSSLNRWVDDNESSVFLLRGVAGSGKTRFMKYWRDQLNERDSGKHLVLFGDFNEVHNDKVVDFEPFIEAINSNLATKNEEWNGVFRDNSSAVESGVKFLSTLGNAAGIPLGEGTGDENRGVKDVAGRFLNMCNQKHSNGTSITIILDNYAWATSDEKSRRLLFELIERLEISPPHRRSLRFVLTFAEQEDNSNSAFLLNELEEGEFHLSKWKGLLGWDSDNEDSLKSSVQNWLTSLEDERAWHSQESPSRISKKLKQHLSNRIHEVIKETDLTKSILGVPSPGDVLKYIQLLEKGGYVEMRGQFIELAKDPVNSGIPIMEGELIESTRRFEALEFESRQLLVSAAHIGFKFDAELLAEIWKMDLLLVLRVLDGPGVEGIFIRDRSNEDNIYAFLNRDIHQRAKRGFAADGSTDRIRQVIIEFQKRALEHVYKKGDAYMLSMDLEVLNSTALDCLNYLGVDQVSKVTSKILLVAAYRNLLVGNDDMVSDFIRNWRRLVLVRRQIPVEMRRVRPDLQSDLEWLGQVLRALNEGHRNLNLAFDDLQQRSAMKSFLHLNEVVTLDGGGIVYLALLEESRLVLDSARVLEPEWAAWQESLIRDWRPTDRVDLELEKDFILACRSRVGSTVAIEEIEAKIPVNEVELKGKVLRKLASMPDYERSQEFSFAAIRHQMLLMRVVTSEEVELDGSTLLIHLQLLHDRFGSVRDREGTNYCFLLNVIRKNFPDDPEVQLAVPRMMIEAGKCQGVRFTRNSGYHWLAMNHIELKQFDKAEKILNEYGDLLLNEGAAASEFQYVLKPLLSLGASDPSGDGFKAFFALKLKMYESLRIISWNLKSEISKVLSDDFSMEHLSGSDLKISSEVERNASTGTLMMMNLLKLVSRIAIADGDLDEAEIHDLSETALACGAHLNLTVSAEVMEEMMGWLNVWKSNLEEDKEAFMAENTVEFERTIEEVNVQCSDGEKRQIVRLCQIVAASDGVVEESEQNLLDALKKGLILDE